MDDFEVVVNHEEQYSIWAADRDVPNGWTRVGFRGPKQDCLDHIAVIWVDMRPKSIRTHIDGAGHVDAVAVDA